MSYSKPTISGYNTSAPADDGSETDANKVKWSTIKSKLGDPTKTYADNINNAVESAFNDLASTDPGKGAELVGNSIQVFNLSDFADNFQDAFTAIQASSPQYSILVIPEGNYTISTKCTMTLASVSKRVTIMAVGKVNITSTVVGDRTWEIIDAEWIRIIGKPKFIGNNLTGASGNGHAIALIDSSPETGTSYPAHCYIDAYIEKFRGLDEDVFGSQIPACGIYIGGGLNNRTDGYYSSNAIGLYCDFTQNMHIDGVYVGCDYWGVVLDDCSDGVTIERNCDIINNGDTSPYYRTEIGSVNVPYGGVYAYSCPGPIYISGKYKNNISSVCAYLSDEILIRDAHIRPQDTNLNGNSAVWVTYGKKLSVIGGDFLCVTSGSANYKGIMYDAGNNTGISNVSVKDVLFDPSDTVDYFVSIDGHESARDICVSISGNIFGSATKDSALTITDCILLHDGSYSGNITSNTFISGNNGAKDHTIVDCIDTGTGFINSGINISGNVDKTYITGTITNPSSGYVQTYSVTNLSTDRSYDANSTSTAELADVLGTLIADLRAKGLVN